MCEIGGEGGRGTVWGYGEGPATGLRETVLEARRSGWILLWSSAIGEIREVWEAAWLGLRLWPAADGTDPEGWLDTP